MQDLNWVDYIILAIFFLSALSGLARGLVKEVMSLATLVIALIVASTFAHPLALSFTNTATVQSVVNATSSTIGTSTAQPVSYAAIGISFALLFAATVLIGSIIGAVINLAFQTGLLGLSNRLLGAVFGLGRGFIMNLVLIFLVQLTSFAGDSFWTQSQLVNMYQPSVQWLASIVSPALDNLKAKASDKLKGVNSSLQNLSR